MKLKSTFSSIALVACLGLVCAPVFAQAIEQDEAGQYVTGRPFDDRKTADVYNSMGTKPRLLNAITLYNRVITEVPNYAEAYCGRGMAYFKLGNTDKALTDINKAIKISPDYQKGHYSKAKVFISLKRYEEAIEELNLVIRLNPRHANGYNQRGVAYKLMGNTEQAFWDFGKALEINPKHTGASVNRGELYYEMGKYERAISDCTIAINPFNNNPENLKQARLIRGKAYQALGQNDNAKKDFLKIVAKDPHNVESNSRLKTLGVNVYRY